MNLIDTIGPIESSSPDLADSHIAVLWEQNALLAQAVGTFLNGLNWRVVRFSDGNVERFFQEIKRLHPEVVIVCQEKSDDCALPWRLIEEKLCPKVLTIGMDSNVMHVYSKQDVLLRGTSDLLSALDSDKVPNCSSRKGVE